MYIVESEPSVEKTIADTWLYGFKIKIKINEERRPCTRLVRYNPSERMKRAKSEGMDLYVWLSHKKGTVRMMTVYHYAS